VEQGTKIVPVLHLVWAFSTFFAYLPRCHMADIFCIAQWIV